MSDTSKMAGRVTKVCQGEKTTYGFIKTDDGRNFFFHAADCIPDSSIHRVGAIVQFKVVPETGGKNPRAIHVEAL